MFSTFLVSVSSWATRAVVSAETAGVETGSTATSAVAATIAVSTTSSVGLVVASAAMVLSSAASAAMETAVLRSAPNVTKDVSRSVEARTTRTGPWTVCPLTVVIWSSPNRRWRPTSAPTLACHW